MTCLIPTIKQVGRLHVAFANFLRRLRGEKRGSTLVLTALSMPVMLGGAGLAVDTVQWTLCKQQLRRAADSAALAGAYAVAQGKSASVSVAADLMKSDQLGYTSTVVENAPTTGSYIANNSAVRVVLATSKTLPFSSIFMSDPVAFEAEATAPAVADGTHCLISLEDGSTPGIEIDGNASLSLGCGAATNSRANDSVVVQKADSLVASPISAVGGISGPFGTNVQLNPYSLPQKDPFANVPDPDVKDMDCSKPLLIGAKGAVSDTGDDKGGGKKTPTTTPAPTADPIGPGCYSSADIDDTFTLPSGTYYFVGDVEFGPKARLTGTGVTIVLTSKTAATDPATIPNLRMNSQTELSLSAPTSGSYANIAIYQDRRALTLTDKKGENHINGGADSNITGAIYFPKQTLWFNGNAGMRSTCLQLVSRRILMSGNATITNNCPPGDPSNRPDFSTMRIRLVA